MTLSLPSQTNTTLNRSIPAVHSTVFKWSGGHFVKLQSLQTYGAHDVKSVTINGHTFLAFTNLPLWKFPQHRFFHLQVGWQQVRFVAVHSTRGALAWHPFVISGQTYANHYDNGQNKTLSLLCTRPLERGSTTEVQLPFTVKDEK